MFLSMNVIINIIYTAITIYIHICLNTLGRGFNYIIRHLLSIKGMPGKTVLSSKATMTNKAKLTGIQQEGNRNRTVCCPVTI